MVNRAALQVPTVGDPHNHRGCEVIIGAIAHERQLIAELHVRGPDVVEELDLYDRLQPANGQADRPADDVGLSQGRVVHPVAPKLPLEAPGDLEDAALPFDRIQVDFAAHVGHILPEHQGTRIPRQLIAQARVQQVHHGGWAAAEPWIVFRIELLGGRIDIG